MIGKTFEEQIAGLAEKSRLAENDRYGEEKTKLYVIMLFMKALGYDVHDPNEVVPEDPADIGIKKGEKVDYTIKIGRQETILIEAKAATKTLNDSHRDQLFRYFTATEAKIGILTNGKEAWFYADLDKLNIMDSKPFFKFNFQQHNQDDIEKLEQFCKNTFDIGMIMQTARTIKNSEKLEKYIKEKILNPDEEFAKFIGKTVNGETPEGDSIPMLQKSIKEVFAKIIDKKRPAITAQNPLHSTQSMGQQTSDIAFPNSQDFEKKYHLLKGKKGFFETISKQPMKSIFLKYVAMIHGLGNIDEKTSKTAVRFYVGDVPFASITPWKTRLKFGLALEMKEIDDPKGLCSKKDIGFYGVGDSYIVINNDGEHDYDYVLRLIKQAYDKAKTINKEPKELLSLSYTEKFRYTYWENLMEYLENSKSNLKQGTPTNRQFKSFGSIKGNILYGMTKSKEKIITVELYIYQDNLFELLSDKKQTIEKEIGEKLVWKPLPNKQASIIMLEKSSDFKNENDWQNQFAWLKEKLEVFYEVFWPYIEKLNSENYHR